jgi:hypothetical protein
MRIENHFLMMLILYKYFYIFKVNLSQTKNKGALFFEMEGVPMFASDLDLM